MLKQYEVNVANVGEGCLYLLMIGLTIAVIDRPCSFEPQLTTKKARWLYKET